MSQEVVKIEKTIVIDRPLEAVWSTSLTSVMTRSGARR
jgi:hypothetical protein